MSNSSLFRSERMSLIQLYIPFEQAITTVSFIGDHGLIQFNDLNSSLNPFQKSFVSEIKKSDFLLNILNVFEKRLSQYHILSAEISMPINAISMPLNELETTISSHNTRLDELVNAYETLMSQKTELEEFMHILTSAQHFFSLAKRRSSELYTNNEDLAPLLEHGNMGDTDSASIHNLNLGYLTGVIDTDKIFMFEKILWRSLRGNLIFSSIEISANNNNNDNKNRRSVFIVFVYGDYFVKKVKKTCDALDAKIYKISDKYEQRSEATKTTQKKINDLDEVLASTKRAMDLELRNIASEVEYWSIAANKQKHIYECLNMFNYDDKRKCLIAEGWCPTYALNEVQSILKNVAESTMSSMSSFLTVIPTSVEPPTYNKTNKFTQGFQEIVNSYGVAKYGEVNPGLFTTISFPFLFAVMFGDFGHGCIMLIAALYLVLNEKRLAKVKGEMFRMMFDGRYIILLMAIFSMFTGMIYNDIFSRSVSIFKSGWSWASDANYNMIASQSGVYPFGLDPAWHGAENSLIFTNSYKMKMSVIFGVVQMTFGIVLTTFNYKHFKKPYSIYLEFIPQILFLQCIFGYLCFTILLKWSTDWFAVDANGNNLYNNPPGLLNMLIYMFLQPGTINSGEQLYRGQGFIQYMLLVIAFVCVPVMLLGKPLYLKREHKRIIEAGYTSLNNETDELDEENSDGENSKGVLAQMQKEKEFDFGDIMIHQMIHTIEFCLGCISNTASYLRLWALSLAHAQLSIVLWDMTIAKALEMKGILMPLAFLITLVLWFILTVSILLIMEGLSAFLHALRLHWVEFNNKFYEGTGARFMPFDFERLLEENAN